jgi:hypothetical protein
MWSERSISVSLANTPLLVLGGAGGPQALLPGFEGDPACGQVIPSFFLLPPPKAAQRESNHVGLRDMRFTALALILDST